MTHPNISRRRFLALTGMTGAGMLLKPSLLFAQQSPVTTIRTAAATAKIITHPLRGGLSMLEGSGGNIIVLPGKDGKLLVDAGITASRPRIIEALQAISKDPVTRLINTHWHFDHTDGNEWLNHEGARILAHTNTQHRLSQTTRVEDWNFTFPASPIAALPTELFDTSKEMKFNGKTIKMRYYGKAHTDSDISVHFADDNVLHTGDTWWNGVYPFIDYSTGGSIDGMIQATDRNLLAVNSKTIVVPGHGAIGNHLDLQDFHTMLTTIRKNVATLKHQGRSLPEIIAARPSKAFDAKWGNFVIGPDFFVKLVYKGV